MKKQHKKKGSIAYASIIRSATAQVQRHKDTSMAQTGTNVVYEGATAPGSGVGTGYSSGQEATGETMRTNTDYEQNRATAPEKDNQKRIDRH